MPEFLFAKVALLPVWAWLLVGSAGGLYVYRRRSSTGTAGGAAQTDTTAGGTPTGFDPSATGDEAQPTASGISPDLLAALLGANSPFQQVLQSIYSGSSASTAQAGSTQGASASPDAGIQTVQSGSNSGSTTYGVIPSLTTPQGGAIAPSTGLGPGAIEEGGGGSLAGFSTITPTASTSVGGSATPTRSTLGHGVVLQGA